MYDRLRDLLIGEAAVRTKIPGTGGGVRIKEPGKPVEFRSAGSVMAPYVGKKVSAGVRAAQRATKMTARKSAPLSDKVT